MHPMLSFVECKFVVPTLPHPLINKIPIHLRHITACCPSNIYTFSALQLKSGYLAPSIVFDILSELTSNILPISFY